MNKARVVRANGTLAWASLLAAASLLLLSCSRGPIEDANPAVPRTKSSTDAFVGLSSGSLDQKPKEPPNPAREFAEAVLTRRSLLDLANSGRFRGASNTVRRSLIRRWCARHEPARFRSLSAEERGESLRLLARWLDDMLAEKDFRFK